MRKIIISIIEIVKLIFYLVGFKVDEDYDFGLFYPIRSGHVIDCGFSNLRVHLFMPLGRVG